MGAQRADLPAAPASEDDALASLNPLYVRGVGGSVLTEGPAATAGRSGVKIREIEKVNWPGDGWRERDSANRKALPLLPRTRPEPKVYLEAAFPNARLPAFNHIPKSPTFKKCGDRVVTFKPTRSWCQWERLTFTGSKAKARCGRRRQRSLSIEALFVFGPLFLIFKT
jgi:hypothetical protein